MESPLLGGHNLASDAQRKRSSWVRALCFFLAFIAVTCKNSSALPPSVYSINDLSAKSLSVSLLCALSCFDQECSR